MKIQYAGMGAGPNLAVTVAEIAEPYMGRPATDHLLEELSQRLRCVPGVRAVDWEPISGTVMVWPSNEDPTISGYRVSLAIRDVHVVPRLIQHALPRDRHLAACALTAEIAKLLDAHGWSSWVMTTMSVGVGVTVTVHCPDALLANRVLVALRDSDHLARAANHAYRGLVGPC